MRGENNPRHSASGAKKREWLLGQRHRWEGMPRSWALARRDPRWLELANQLAREMKQAGLFSKKTYIIDVESSVVRLINKLREEE
jgi:hypothetical protein